MIKEIRITNFKSLANVTVTLSPVTVLIGRSGSGKTNFVQAFRFLRDLLASRSLDHVLGQHGGWVKLLSATLGRGTPLKYNITYHFDPGNVVFGEELVIGNRPVFHQHGGKWVHTPPLAEVAAPGTILLGALTGLRESSDAYRVLKNGIGCYGFPDNVLAHTSTQPPARGVGLQDDGSNYLSTYIDLETDFQVWQRQREIVASLRKLKPNLKSIDLVQPQQDRIVVTLELDGRRLPLELHQESEGFRRLLACLLALYQTPPKQLLIFDEPEKGIYPAVLKLLAEEFQSCSQNGRGQVLLTTHSPEFLDQFSPEQIRVVEMVGYTTRIGPMAADQIEAVREHFLKPGELLTVDPARLAETALAG